MSPTVNRVLVAVDFDAPSGAAVAAAGVIAEAFGAVLRVAHAASIEMPPYFTGGQLEALQRQRRDTRGRLANDLLAFTAPSTHMPVEVIVEEGPAADTILRLAVDSDLLVVGTHRLRGTRRWWLGSVAEAVVRRASVPVLVVPADATAEGLRRGATLVAPGGADAAAVDPWVRALEDVLQMTVETTPIARCGGDRLRHADLVVVPLPVGGADGPEFHAIVEVLKDCVHPVLFVPAAGAAVARSSV
jgi:nucleotide-binding universal stress UspA family protein